MFSEFVNKLPLDIIITIGMCIIGCFCVAVVMRFFVKPCLAKLDDYFDNKCKSEKAKAIYHTIKAIGYTLLAFVLTFVALLRLYSVCTFPYDNTKALLPFFLIPMLALQYFFDKHMKNLEYKIFGFEPEPAEEKPAKPKVYTKKVQYVLDDDGNEVPVE